MKQPGRFLATLFATLGAVGALVVATGLWVDLRRTLFAYLTAYVFAVSIAVGALLFIAIAHVTGAGWMALLRRRAEDIGAAFPLLLGLSLPLLAGVPWLYSWAGSREGWSAELKANLGSKAIYLNRPFFTVRALIYLAAWTALAEALRSASRRQDSSAESLIERQVAISAAALPIVAFTLTFASFDWLMSLDPTWSSNVFGIYLFGGGFGAAGGLIALLAFGPFPSRVGRANAEHAHALGRILLTFVIFWAYIAFTQYLLVWIADKPNEVPWVGLRTTGAWGGVALSLAIGHFALPFGALLSRDLKRRGVFLAWMGAWLVFAHYVDLYWVVMPQLLPRPQWSWVDLGPLLFVFGATTTFVTWRAKAEPEVPAGDPRVLRGLDYRVTQ